MTPKEQFEEISITVEDRNLRLKYIDEKMQCINKCEQIADEFAIEFIYWLGVNNYKNYSNGWANLFTKVMSEKELLEKFKKEKGL